MKRLLSLLIILLAAGGALYFAQHRDARDAVSSNVVVDVAADLQRDVTRVSMRVTRLSDADEIRIGDELAQRYGLSTAPQRCPPHTATSTGSARASPAMLGANLFFTSTWIQTPISSPASERLALVKTLIIEERLSPSIRDCEELS